MNKEMFEEAQAQLREQVRVATHIRQARSTGLHPKVRVAEEGVLLKAFDRLTNLWALSEAEKTSVLGRERDTLTAGELSDDSIRRMANAIAIYKMIGGGPDNGARWLREPNPLFGWEMPINILMGDTEAGTILRGTAEAQVELERAFESGPGLGDA